MESNCVLIKATEKQRRAIILRSFINHSPDSQTQNTLLLFLELAPVDQELVTRQLRLYASLR